jgi:hypothetical protein
MGISTDAVAWFGYPGVEDFSYPADCMNKWEELVLEGVEEVYVGWYDSCVRALAVPGTVKVGDWCGTPIDRREVDAAAIEKLKAAAARCGFPTESEPRWYFAPRQM